MITLKKNQYQYLTIIYWYIKFLRKISFTLVWVKNIHTGTNIYNQEIEIPYQNNDEPIIFSEATDRSTCDVDTTPPVNINPYVDENVDFSTELIEENHTYPSTVFNTEKPISNKNIISIMTKINDDLENEFNYTFLQQSLLTSK